MTDAEKRGRDAAISGFAHEHIAAGILMKRYGNVSLVDLPLSPYDIVIVRKSEQGEDIIRCQVKTAQNSVQFTSGSRGGVDREYVSNVKVYRQSPKTCDVVIGVHPRGPDSYDLYFVPTILIDKLSQGSISLSKIERLKNNYEMLNRCKASKYVISQCQRFGIIPSL
ncbi:MAG: hypothetical protein JW856_04060 [Dehalococcoidales bacterium]|nr:hypothetical protein [Dehalococcoidales bacterium]